MLELLCAIFALKSLTIGSFTNILKKLSIFIGPPFVSQSVWAAWFPKCRSAATAERGSREGTCVPCENGSCVCGNSLSRVVCDRRALSQASHCSPCRLLAVPLSGQGSIEMQPASEKYCFLTEIGGISSLYYCPFGYVNTHDLHVCVPYQSGQK